jgi:hypothetical protein
MTLECPSAEQRTCGQWAQRQLQGIRSRAQCPGQATAGADWQPQTQRKLSSQECDAQWSRYGHLQGSQSDGDDPNRYTPLYHSIVSQCGPLTAAQEAMISGILYQHAVAKMQQQRTPTTGGNAGSACEALHAEALSRATASLGFDQTLANKFNAECMHRCVPTGMTVRCQ